MSKRVRLAKAKANQAKCDYINEVWSTKITIGEVINYLDECINEQNVFCARDLRAWLNVYAEEKS